MYEFSTYHVLLAVLGAGIILAYWIPRFVSGREPAASALLILGGAAASFLVPGLSEGIDPLRHPHGWEIASELALIVGLFGTGLRIDRLVTRARWMPTVRLLAIGMPLTIVAVAVLGGALGGLTLAAAILLGAVLAPTDPVLAADVQVGPPLEGGEHPVRFSLTAEAGLNDGLAFPFVHLALAVAAAGAVSADLLLHWAWLDVLYRVAVGTLCGIGLGWLLGRLLFDFPSPNPLAETESGVVAVAGVIVCYGVTELAEGYGFIASFIAGMTLRRSEEGHEFHRRLHAFTETLEQTLTAFLLVGIGAVLPHLWPSVSWSGVVLALALILLIRPLAGWAALAGTDLKARERVVVAFYGVRGIGSIYYIAYAANHQAALNTPWLWSTVAVTILISTVIHGLTAGLAVERVAGEKTDAGPDAEEEGADEAEAEKAKAQA